MNIYLLLFYGFYALLLRKETFFHLNRVYLVAAALLSFFIPMIQSDWVKNLFLTREVQLTIYNSPLITFQFEPIQHTQVTIGQVFLLVYIAGIVLLTGRLIWQMIVLNKVINKPDATVAYSFFKKVKLGAHHADNAIIAAHEKVHANQWHSADVLLIEAVMIINWFNPVVYFYRFAIKHIHEYIADRQALRSGTTKSEYALLLLSQTFNTPAHQLVNPFFNDSLLKLRIMMLEKDKSKRMALVKYGLSAPLFIMMLILSSATISNNKTINFVNKKAEQVFLTPAKSSPDNALTQVTIVSQKQTRAGKAKTKASSITINRVHSKRDIVFTAVERVPQFPGGLPAFGRYLAKNIRYPAKARENGVQGRVIISFIVEKDGSLTDAHITRGVSAEIDKEALRVMTASPDWEPGIQNGKKVRVAYTVPISFTLSE
ncbi:MAG: TonB family protein [Mucilaginibacter sp.]